MKLLQKRWFAFFVCALMILASFAISAEKKSDQLLMLETGSIPLLDASGNRMEVLEILIDGDLIEQGFRLGMVSIGVIFFSLLITLLIFAAVIMSLVRAGRRKYVSWHSVRHSHTTHVHRSGHASPPHGTDD